MLSKGERELGNLLKEEFPNNIIKTQAPIKWGKLILYVDYLLPELKLAIEYDGRQHLDFVPHFHKDKSSFTESKIRDQYKEEILEYLEYTLIKFNYKEELDKNTLRKKIQDCLELRKQRI